MEGLVKYLVEEKGFRLVNCTCTSDVWWLQPSVFYSEERIRSGAKKLEKSKQGATQGRLDMFFKPVPGVKRKVRFNTF